MRRFSQRQGLVTLSDINITPLLDLAFVLLIIFIITTPLLEQGVELDLPQGGIEDAQDLEKSDIATVDISTNGWYYVSGDWRPLDLATTMLTSAREANPKLLVYIRADKVTPYEHVAAILSELKRSGVDKVSLRMDLPD